MKPWEYSRLSHKDYILLCIGHENKVKRQYRRDEYLARELNYNIVKGWADHTKLPNKTIWWPIDGEPVKRIKLPSKAKLKQYEDMFRKLGKRHG